MPQLRGMQLMRQGVHTSRYIEDLLTQFIHAITDFILGIRRNMSHPFECYRPQCEPLADIIVQVSGDPRPFGLLRLNQFSAQTREGLFRKLLLSDVRDHAYHADHRAVPIEKSMRIFFEPDYRTVWA